MISADQEFNNDGSNLIKNYDSDQSTWFLLFSAFNSRFAYLSFNLSNIISRRDDSCNVLSVPWFAFFYLLQYMIASKHLHDG